MTATEIEKLFEVVGRLREQGFTIIFISHRLDEVTQLVDRITVLRDGETIGTAPTKEMSPEEICRMIAGTDISNLYPKIETNVGETMLEVNNFSGEGI